MKYAVFALVASAWLILSAAPAGAHTLTGVQPTNYRSELAGIDPPTPGLRVRLFDLGRQVELTNQTGRDIVVLGYDGDPYLRVGLRGVFENEWSPTRAQNRLAPGGATVTTLPSAHDPNDAPAWQRRHGGANVRWRDQRTRWEGGTPPQVRAAHGRPVIVVPAWTIDLRDGSSAIRVVGRIRWVPPPSAARWLLGAVVLFAATVAVAWTRRFRVTIALLLAALVAVDVVHSVGAAAASPGSATTVTGRLLLGGIFSTAGWVLGGFAVSWLLDGEDSGLFAALGSTLIITLFGGIGDLTALGRSQVPFAFASGLDRVFVTFSLGAGLGVAAAIALLIRRLGLVTIDPDATPAQ